MKKNEQQATPDMPDAQGRPPGPFEKEPIKVSLGVYMISLVVVFLAVFIFMLVIYLPGHRNYAKIKHALEHASSVNVEAVVYGEDLPEDSSFSPNDEKNKLTEVIEGMGAKNVTVVVEQLSKEKKEEKKEEEDSKVQDENKETEEKDSSTD